MKYYQIGEFSKLCNLSVRTLHYYDDIGILKPIVAEENRYRYYDENHLLIVNKIKLFRRLEFSIEEIKYLMNVDTLENEPLLVEKEKAVTEKMMHLRLHHELLQQWTTLSDNRSEDVFVKRIPSTNLLFERYRSESTPEAFYLRFTRLRKLSEDHNLTMCGNVMAIYHDHYKSYNPMNADIEVCVRVAEDIEHEHVRKWGDFLVVCAYHYGAYHNMNNTYAKMLDWCKTNGFKMIGPGCEEYIIDPVSGKDEDLFVTLLTIPISS
ncbi:DNA-binding transcriptional MerR regulator [Breznakia sp. PF5-3]|uniref:MerR family transcriptional regulator n=1 Tax=unclassified Breznakia TaxID=2623764 RepID=UPI0024056656|nr:MULTISPECIES: MerR family transcriptional regulator [unclassified Breznakia]MDF9824143.1 DNA-binding transcriptional MerR regulator [Breznakia sp. PM6-1]MDF9834941.1 DNA-binding transcriptional MerR regulator [Breznakia sp. PF5-3]MDF9837190.1 DNA-binding transcriptional MerR regulator [Breznakia sp. PFB2-8]MDF9859180.1 DNA-binding transcriptional MerR regulator [Breznakia sp. PH5-24]